MERICSKCKESNKEFNKNQKYCRDCQKEYKAKWKEANGEKKREKDREWIREKRQNQAFRDIENARRRTDDFREKNNLKYRNLSPEEKEKVNKLRLVNFHKRMARKRNLKADLTIKQWRLILEIFNNECAYCGKKGESLQQDHIIPVSKNGAYTFSNIIPACGFCNNSKHNNDWFDWYVIQHFFDIVRAEKIRSHLES